MTANNYINSEQGAPRPDDEEMIGDIVHKGEFSTRIGPNRHMTYDGRLVQKVSVTEGDVQGFVRSSITGHAMRSLIKGMFMTAPHLITGKTEMKVVEALLQTSAVARKIGKDRLITMMGETPLLILLTSLSAIQLHDGDVERAHPVQWWKWRKVDILPPGSKDRPALTSASIEARRQRLYTNSWTRAVSTAKTLAEGANETKKKMASSQVPSVALFTTKTDRYDTEIKPVKQVTPEIIQSVNRLV